MNIPNSWELEDDIIFKNTNNEILTNRQINRLEIKETVR